MDFHLGKPILVMICIALLAGAVITTRKAQKKADLTVWLFADTHYQSFIPIVPTFEQRTGTSVNLNLVVGQAMDLRLSSLFLTDPYSPELPDLVEIEIGWVGKYFRPPRDMIGFIPLNDMLKESGLDKRLVRQRLTPWMKEDLIFGVPHDVHPVTITYREDFYREAGIELPSVKTWPEAHEAFLKFERYWTARGHPQRHAIEAGTSDTSIIQEMLLQRHINVIDQYNRVHINDPRVAHTVAFYAQMVAGPRKVGGQSIGNTVLANDLNQGNLCAFVSPDWKVNYLKRFMTASVGRMRMMPLPKFEPSDAPTSTWGGTAICITRACRRPGDAWKLIEFLYFSEEALRVRQEESAIIPPDMTVWDHPLYHEPDPFFGGQRTGELFIQLARQIPERYQSPASVLAAGSLSLVLDRALDYIVERGSSDGLEAACQDWLNLSAKDLERRIAHWRFDE